MSNQPMTMPIVPIPAPQGVPPYLWAVIVMALVAALAGIGVHIQAPDAPTEPEPTPSTATECECECATPATVPDLTTEPQVGTEV